MAPTCFHRRNSLSTSHGIESIFWGNISWFIWIKLFLIIHFYIPFHFFVVLRQYVRLQILLTSLLTKYKKNKINSKKSTRKKIKDNEMRCWSRPRKWTSAVANIQTHVQTKLKLHKSSLAVSSVMRHLLRILISLLYVFLFCLFFSLNIKFFSLDFSFLIKLLI